MVDLSHAERSEVMKLEFGHEDFLLFRQCLSTVYQKKDKLPPHVVSLIERNISDLALLLEVMKEEGNVE